MVKPAVVEYVRMCKGAGADDDGVTLEKARIRKDLSQAKLNEIKLETEEKMRIHRDELDPIMAECFGQMRATIDADPDMSEKGKDNMIRPPSP